MSDDVANGSSRFRSSDVGHLDNSVLRHDWGRVGVVL